MTDQEIVAALVEPVIGHDTDGYGLHLTSGQAFRLVPAVRKLLAVRTADARSLDHEEFEAEVRRELDELVARVQVAERRKIAATAVGLSMCGTL